MLKNKFTFKISENSKAADNWLGKLKFYKKIKCNNQVRVLH